jgi:hypothetical protein
MAVGQSNVVTFIVWSKKRLYLKEPYLWYD